MVAVQSDPELGFFLTQSGINSSLPSKMSERTVVIQISGHWSASVIPKKRQRADGKETGKTSQIDASTIPCANEFLVQR